MSNILRIDLAILGGGCAGLSLAKQLSQMNQWKKKTWVIESRTEYVNDRSWCFWEPKDERLLHDLNKLITNKWPQWQFSSDNFRVVHNGEGRHYCYLPSGHFYNQAIECINSHPAMELRMGIQVVSVTPEGNGYLIKLSDGTRIFSHRIVDTRPATYSHSEQSKLWQIFYGVEIKASTPLFDPTCVGLMNHLVSSHEGTQFIYILPFSTQHALIEWTVFTTQLSSPNLIAPLLHKWLHAQFDTAKLEIIRTEQAVLPMGLNIAQPARPLTPQYIYGGQVAGAIRPATGYAFLRIQRWARECAQQIAQEKISLACSQSKWIIRAMDDLFLTVLRNEPQKGVLLFQALAQHVPPARLVRFLSDETSILDYVSVMRALPSKLFLRYGLNMGQWLNRIKLQHDSKSI